MLRLGVLVVLLCVLEVSLATTPRSEARITNLPGYRGRLPEMYSGYVTVDPVKGRNIFYWLVLSPNSANDPLVLWLQGIFCLMNKFY